jgi:putative FmdB family regulatory protein
MPIFNYRCSDCDNEFEILSMPGDSEVECSNCGGKNLKKIFSSFDFNMKESAAGGNCPSGGCQNGSCGLN